jgi:hypothetical protein
MKNFFKFLGIIALVAVTGFSFTACKSGDGDGGSSGRDSRLVLGDGWAWFEDYAYEGHYYEGIIFKADGTIQNFVIENDEWESEYGKWSTTGNNSLTLVWDDFTETISYTVTDKALTFHEPGYDDSVYEKNRIPK